MPILTILLGNWRIVLIACLAAACAALWWRSEYLSARVDAAVAANAAYAKQAVILESERKDAIARAIKAEKLKGDIRNAQDGSVAPALRVALDGLRDGKTAADTK